jgi:hypothetical protein
VTDAQIANLRERTDERCSEGEGINVTKADVERLLDERKALLIVAKRAREQLGPIEGKVEAWRLALELAISYAEAEG